MVKRYAVTDAGRVVEVTHTTGTPWGEDHATVEGRTIYARNGGWLTSPMTHAGSIVDAVGVAIGERVATYGMRADELTHGELIEVTSAGRMNLGTIVGTPELIGDTYRVSWVPYLDTLSLTFRAAPSDIIRTPAPTNLIAWHKRTSDRIASRSPIPHVGDLIDVHAIFGIRIPARIIGVDEHRNVITYKVTGASRNGWHRGDIDETNTNNVSIRRHRGIPRRGSLATVGAFSR
jgi:hypothetical protein